jgi:hypothetical protein
LATEPGVKKIAGMYIMLTKRGPLFLADTTINFNPTAEELAEITLLTAKEVSNLISYHALQCFLIHNFGSSDSPEANLVRKARELVKGKDPTLICDGGSSGYIGIQQRILKDNYRLLNLLDGEVNTLIFPNLAAGNIAYNLLQEVGGADSIGPILLGLNKPVHVLQLGSSLRSIFNMVLIAVVDAQMKCETNTQEAITTVNGGNILREHRMNFKPIWITYTVTKKKISFEVSKSFRKYLKEIWQGNVFAVSYDNLRHFQFQYPRYSIVREDTLWESVFYSFINR